MFDSQHYFSDFYEAIAETPLHEFSAPVSAAIVERMTHYTHGFLPKWMQILDSLPTVQAHSMDLVEGVSIGNEQSLTETERLNLSHLLKQFHPWRKGPYSIHGIHIDTEWRSDWKWQRIRNNIHPLNDRLVLDIGCGNAYHCWRMLGAGAKMVIGIDPSQIFWMQFQAIKHFLGPLAVHFLPIGIENLPAQFEQFDTVFSMGVLYHRKSPFEHLQHLRMLLREGGELVLETLIIEGDQQSVLDPADRYACMANVWFIPSALALEQWLKKAGFKNIRLIDCNQTTHDEQRATEWMHFQSLSDFLDPKNPNKTLEGHPGPLRACFVAEK